MSKRKKQPRFPSSSRRAKRIVASTLLCCSALVAALATSLPTLVFRLDTQRIFWTPASDGQYGIWALWAAAAVSVTAALLSWRGRKVIYLPLLTAILLTLATIQNLLSGFGHIPKVGSHRVLVIEKAGQWSDIAQATHLQTSAGMGLFVVGTAILGLCMAAWALHRDSRNDRTGSSGPSER